jgi:hypothetical protein
MKKYIEKLSTTKYLLMLFIGFVILYTLSNTVFKQSFVYLTQTYNYTAEYAYRLMRSIGEAGRKAHLLILLSDLIMVILYTNFLFGINYRLMSSITKKCHVISVITFSPLLLALVQLGEMTADAILVLNYKSEYANIAHLANTLTILKYNLTVICFGLPLVLLCANIILKLLSKRKMKFEG